MSHRYFPSLRLTVECLKSQCRLSLQLPGEGKPTTGMLEWSVELERVYQRWRERYRDYYSLLGSARFAAFTQNLYASNLDEYRTDLWEVEVVLRQTFNHWLRQPGCAQVRDQLHYWLAQRPSPPPRLLLYSSDPLLQALPWDAWEGLRTPAGTLGFAIQQAVAIAGPLSYGSSLQSERPARLLLVGDWAERRQAIQAQLYGEVRVLELRGSLEPVCRALCDPKGWDLLGWQTPEHSLAGILQGPLGQALSLACQRGLWLALVNTADGLNLATDWLANGLRQAVILQQPTPEPVAAVVLESLLGGLLAEQPVAAALHQIRQELAQRDLEYPVLQRIPTLLERLGPELSGSEGDPEPHLSYCRRLVLKFRAEPAQIARGESVSIQVDAPEAEALELTLEPPGQPQAWPLTQSSLSLSLSRTTRLTLTARRQWAGQTVTQVYTCQVSVVDRRGQSARARPATAADLLAQALATDSSVAALSWVQQAAALEPNQPEVLYHLGRLNRSLGRIPEAIAAFEQACRYAPTDARAQCSLGLLLLGQGQLEQAEAHLRRALALDPQDIEARRNLALVERKLILTPARSRPRQHRQQLLLAGLVLLVFVGCLALTWRRLRPEAQPKSLLQLSHRVTLPNGDTSNLDQVSEV